MPDGTGHHGERRSTSRGTLFIGAILLVALGFVVLGGLTSSDSPTAVVETTTTTLSPTTTTTDPLMPPIDLENFSVEQLETGPQFEWQQATIDDTEGHPIALLDHGGHLYLFVVSQREWQRPSGGMLAWRSSDGVAWESLGQVISDDYGISQVESTPGGLVAAGTTLDHSQIVVWTSSDAVTWTSDEIPVDTGHPHIHPFVTAVGANRDALVVVTNVQLDGDAMLEERLAEAGYEVELDLRGWEPAYPGTGGLAVRVLAPLGLPGIEIPLDELDLTPEEEQWLQTGYDASPEVRTFAKPAGTKVWARGRIDGAQWVERIILDEDGTMMLTGWLGSGYLILSSSDGIEWTDPSIDVPSNQVHPWRDGLVAVEDSGRPELLYRGESGSDWEPLGLTGRFPIQIQWRMQALGTGRAGLAVAMHGYRTTGPQTSPDPVEVVTDEGHVLSLDLEGGVMTLEDDGVIHTWSSYRTLEPEGVVVDMEAGTVTLSDPETGAPLTALDFEELREAENEYYSNFFIPDEHVAFAFTEDGAEWTIQATSSAFGQSSSIMGFAVGSDRISAITAPQDQPFGPYADFEFDVWTAELP